MIEKELMLYEKNIDVDDTSIEVVNCSYFEGAERARRERGRECMYNYKGELQGCNYIK